MRILVTGASGFIGKHLTGMLEDGGYELVHLVRAEKGFENEFLWDFKGNLPEGLPACDAVVHLAAHVDFSLNLDIAQYDVNTVSTIKLSAYAKAQNAYFVMASMVGVHGSNYAMVDKDTPLNPENHYALSKYLAEEVVRTYVDNYSILRICGVYGLGGPAHLGLNTAISNAVREKKPPVLSGVGRAKRNYICVLDVDRWILYLIQRCETGKTSRETLYIAGPEVLTIEQYLEIIVDTVLPGEDLVRAEGNNGKDFIVRSSLPPFEIRTFRSYINSLVTNGTFKEHAEIN